MTEVYTILNDADHFRYPKLAEQMMTDLAERLNAVLARIQEAERRFQRPPGTVTLLAVSKMQSSAAIADVVVAGQRHFGENYLQEALKKICDLRELKLNWHFIGPIQSNKTRRIAENFNWVHSVDRLKIAQRLNEQRPIDLPPLNICLQVNISEESSKQGLTPGELDQVAFEVVKLPRLRLRGLMTIPALTTDFAAQRQPYAQLSALQAKLIDRGLVLDTLSMGMSNDLEAAIAEGATIVRVGTAIFGLRN
jgi:pyridoxal phosphate enzyme (YggS family)